MNNYDCIQLDNGEHFVAHAVWNFWLHMKKAHESEQKTEEVKSENDSNELSN